MNNTNRRAEATSEKLRHLVNDDNPIARIHSYVSASVAYLEDTLDDDDVDESEGLTTDEIARAYQGLNLALDTLENMYARIERRRK